RGHGVKPEVLYDDDPYSAEEADVQLVHVVPGHVLDDFRPAFRILPVGVDDPDGNDEIPRGPIAEPPRTARVRRQDATERGQVCVGRIQPDELPVSTQDRL